MKDREALHNDFSALRVNNVTTFPDHTNHRLHPFARRRHETGLPLSIVTPLKRLQYSH